MSDLIFQEIIPSFSKVLKVYNIFQKIIIDFSNPLDLEAYEDLERISAAIVLKDITKIDSDLEKEKKIFFFLAKELRKFGVLNFGMDLVRRGNEFFLLDLNPDTFSWLRYQEPGEFVGGYREKIREIYEEINC